MHGFGEEGVRKMEYESSHGQKLFNEEEIKKTTFLSVCLHMSNVLITFLLSLSKNHVLCEQGEGEEGEGAKKSSPCPQAFPTLKSPLPSSLHE